MTSATDAKTMARLEARVSPEIKAMWQKAADLEGRTLTDFVIASLQEAAYTVIAKHQTLMLNREDSELFVEALLNPPLPNEALKAAAIKYKQTMRA
jgi:uncharacterized protein (DUF1778 family)